jgi:hypothetical protein
MEPKMNEAADQLRIDKLKADIKQVEALIENDKKRPDKPSTRLSIRSWTYELDGLQKELAEAILWDSMTCAERIEWCQDKIASYRFLIAGGVAIPGSGMPSILDVPADSPRHFEWARGVWETKISTLESRIREESAKHGLSLI